MTKNRRSAAADDDDDDSGDGDGDDDDGCGDGDGDDDDDEEVDGDGQSISAVTGIRRTYRTIGLFPMSATICKCWQWWCSWRW